MDKDRATLSEELAEAQRLVGSAETSWSAVCLSWAQRESDLLADVRALAVLLTDLDIDCNHCKDRINEALARPGVVRVLAEEEVAD